MIFLRKRISSLVFLAGLSSMVAFTFVVLPGCVPTQGAKSCDQLAEDYLAKFNDIMAIMPPQTEADSDRIQRLICEAVGILDQLLAQGCSQADAADIAATQQILDQMAQHCD